MSPHTAEIRFNTFISCVVPITLSILTSACTSNASNPQGIAGSNAGIGGGSVGVGGLLAGGSGGQSNTVAGSGGSSSGGKVATGGATGGSSGKAGVGGTTGAAGNGGKGGSIATTGCGNGGGKYRGKSNQTVTAANLSRTFVLYESSKLDAKKPAPLVIVPHGFTMSGEAMFTITGYDKVADSDGLVVAYPDGQGGTNPLSSPWYVGGDVCGLGAFVAATEDVDQAFMDEIIKFVDADQCVDRNHIYMTGFSMGGYFSNETACINTTFRATGPHSGGTHDLSGCANKHKPIIIFHFKSDSLISYDCGVDARDKWVAHNGCNATGPDVVTVKGGSCEYYKSCPADGQVAFCSFDEPSDGGGELLTGHAWSGGTADPFAIPQTESATALGWGFFKKYAW
jgi:poly(3-hydroxybutyrate) depolymerase